MKKALITGITGQDGSYLAEFLLDKGYEIHGIVRRVALEDPDHRLHRIKLILPRLTLHPGTIENYPRLTEIFDKVRPAECYHLAAQSFVHESFDDSFSTFATNINGTLNILSALRTKSPETRFYFAGSSEMFGKVKESPQNENTPFHPRSPYGISKVTGFDLTRNYREAYDVFACSGILYNHESPRRGREFVTRKITSGIARMKAGKENVLLLGNLDAKRDWGFAGNYVRAMWMMLQQGSPEDFVIATGQTCSIKNFLDLAFDKAGITYSLIDLRGLREEEADNAVRDLSTKKDFFVVQHPRFYRPSEVDILQGDYANAKRKLGWAPTMSLEGLVELMVESDSKNPL